MDVMELRRGLMMGAVNTMPSNIYHGFFTPTEDTQQIEIDTGLINLDDNGSVNIAILTHDIEYSVANQSAHIAIIQYIGYVGNGGSFNRYMCCKPAGTNDWWHNGTVALSNGVLSISGVYAHFIANCQYEVIVLT